MEANGTLQRAGRDGLIRRGLVTLGAVAVYRLSQSLPTPGIDANAGVLAEFFGASGAPPASGGAPWAAILPHGLMSYMGAALVVLLLSAVLPPLRRLREGSPAQNALFDRLIVALALISVLVQGWGSALYLEGLAGPVSGRPLVPDPGWIFRLTCSITAAGGLALLVWLAHAVSRYGLGNGVAVLLAAEMLAGMGVALHGEYRALSGGAISWGQGLLGLAALALAAAAAAAATRAVRRLPLVRDGAAAAPGEDGPAIRLRLNATGVLPVRGTRTLIPLGLAGQNYLGVVFLGVPGLTDLSPTGVTAVVATIAIGAVLVLALTHLYAFMTVDPRDAVQRVGRLGYVVAGAGSREEAAAAVRRTQRGLATANAGYLVLVALAPWVLDHALGVSPSVASYCGTHMLVLAAVAMQVAAQARQELALGVARWQRGNDEPWVSVWTAETELEVELGQRLLRQAGIPASPRCNRVVAATGTLSYWEVARPRWPGLTIHRRLGGGGAQLLVPEGEVARARDLLEGQARD